MHHFFEIFQFVLITKNTVVVRYLFQLVAITDWQHWFQAGIKIC